MAAVARSRDGERDWCGCDVRIRVVTIGGQCVHPVGALCGHSAIACASRRDRGLAAQPGSCVDVCADAFA